MNGNPHGLEFAYTQERDRLDAELRLPEEQRNKDVISKCNAEIANIQNKMLESKRILLLTFN